MNDTYTLKHRHEYLGSSNSTSWEKEKNELKMLW